MKVLLTGANGLLGQKVLQLAPKWAYVIATDLQEGPVGRTGDFPYRRLDITDASDVRGTVERTLPDWIINTAAYTNVDGCEDQRDLCWRVNVDGVANLCAGARSTGARILHISTDYVFDGAAGPYREEDRPNAAGYYGKSKLESERVVEKSAGEFVIVRTNVLYGQAEGVRPNFVHWVLGKLQAGEPFKVVTDQVGNPTLADDLAEALWTLAAAEARGVYHLGGADFLDRRSFAVAIAEVFGHSPALIGQIATADLGQKAPRPLRSGLIWDKARRRYGIRMKGVREGLAVMRAQLQNAP